MIPYFTPAGKEIQLRRDPRTQHLKIEFASGGELPQDLSGLFTDERQAEKVIVMYLEKVKDKKPKIKE